MQTVRKSIMKELLKNSGWENYRTGCSCVGLPRYWRNEDSYGWEIITKGDSFFRIIENGVEVFAGASKYFEEKMKENNLI